MKNNDQFNELVSNDILSTRFMIGVLVMVEIIIQTFSLMVKPTDWWTWQLLGFITATNLGALILGIVAQRSAEQLSKTYKQVFTPDFYFTVKTLTDFRKIMQAEAEKEGRNMTEEWAELAPKIYGVARKWLDVRYAQDLKIPPDLKDLGIVLEEGFNPESVSDEELFNP